MIIAMFILIIYYCSNRSVLDLCYSNIFISIKEFVITQYLKVHPMALIHPHNVKNILEQNKINELISIYNNNGSEYMIRTISEGVGTVAAAFYPRPVVIRLSDFKSNEYASLIGISYITRILLYIMYIY